MTGLAAPSAGLGRTTARLGATLNNQDGLTTTVCFRYRTPPSGGSWTSAGCDSTTGASLEVTLSGLTPGTQYRAQASLSSSFPSSGRQQVDFTTTTNAGPVFPSSPLTRNVDENVLAGHNVGAPVTATDADGDTLTYTLGGTDAASFAIGSATGQITVGSTTSLDYETKPSYSVTVTATDTHSATATATVTIAVNDLREAGVLGRIVITVGGSGSNDGYDSGSYGTLDSGNFPGALFGDGNSRTVAEIYEDSGGYWYLTYSGGTADDWLSDDDALAEIVMEVTYEDGRDLRSFVLGGFIDSRPGSRGLKLDPPIPSRDWADKDGEEIAIEFYRHRSQAAAVALPPAAVGPPVDSGSLAEALMDAPGTPVDLQMMLTVFVYTLLAVALPFKSGWDVLLLMASLILTPWVPVGLGLADPSQLILGSLLSVLMVAGWFGQRFLARRSG